MKTLLQSNEALQSTDLKLTTAANNNSRTSFDAHKTKREEEENRYRLKKLWCKRQSICFH